jgi:hypothetical protein
MSEYSIWASHKERGRQRPIEGPWRWGFASAEEAFAALDALPARHRAYMSVRMRDADGVLVRVERPTKGEPDGEG